MNQFSPKRSQVALAIKCQTVYVDKRLYLKYSSQCASSGKCIVIHRLKCFKDPTAFYYS